MTVFGISLDDVRAQAAFHAAQELNFPLLSDPDGSVAAKYAVLAPGGRFTQRKTFLIDRAGILRHVDDKVDVTKHGASIADWIKAAK